MYAHRGDLANVAQAAPLPGLTRIGGLIDAAADRDIAADLRRSRAGVDYRGIRERDLDRAHGGDFEIFVGDVDPRVTGVGSFPNSAAGRAHVEGVGLRRNS